jgi:hypothetical protein
VVRIDAVSRDVYSRITTTITAAGGAPVDGERLHVQALYDEEYASMLVILAGGLGAVAETLKLIDVLVES